MISRIENTND